MNFVRKIVLIGSIVIVCISAVFFIKVSQNVGKTPGITIGILQSISHPALDQAREGFTKTLARCLGDQVSFVVQNAEGSMATAQTIAQSFHLNPNITVFFAIGTLATQAMSKVEKQKPIIFGAVTDPVALGVVGPTSNVCGASDAIEIPMSVQTLISLCPQAKRVAMLFNPTEANSVSLVYKMESSLQQMGILSLQIGINNEAEIPAAVSIAIRKADVLWIPTDNTIANTMSMVGRLALKAKKPLFICDNLLVTDGVLASAGGVDYVDCGSQAAQLAVKILKGKCEPAQLGIVNTPSKTVAVHRATCSQLGIKIPNEVGLHVAWVK